MAAEAGMDAVGCDDKLDEDGKDSPASPNEAVPTTSSTADDYAYRPPSGADVFKWHQGRIHDNQVKVWTGTKRLEPDGSTEETELVESLRKSRADTLGRVGSLRPIDVLQALWDDQEKRVVVTKHKGTYLKFMGTKVGDRTVLHPLEALFLLEANQLLLTRDGTSMSISESYEVLLKDGDDYDKYLVYSHLLRAGYIAIPHKKQESSKTSTPAKPEAKKVKDEPHESDDDVVCLDDSDDSDISIIEVIPAKLPKLNPSVTIRPATSPKKSLFPEKRPAQSAELSFPKYVAGQLLTLKRPPRHLLPTNVYPSREWYEVDTTGWKQEESIREKRRTRGWYEERPLANWDQRHNSGRRNPAIPELRPDPRCQGNGEAWQAADASSWHATNNSTPTIPEQRRDGRTWNNSDSAGYRTGQPRGPYQGGDGPWNNMARPPYDASHDRPWWSGGGGGAGQPQPWNLADPRGGANLERVPPPLPWGPGQPWRSMPPPPLPPLPPLLPSWPRNPQEGAPHGSGNQYGYFTETYVSEVSQRSQESRRSGSSSSFHSGPGRPDRPNRPNQASYRRTVQRNDSPRRNWHGRPHRPSHWQRSGGRGGPDEEDYPSALPPFPTEASSWTELKSGRTQAERSAALLACEGAVLWKGSIQPLVVPTRDLSIPGIVSELMILKEVDLVNGGRHTSSPALDGAEPLTPDLDVYLPGTSYTKRNPGTPECRVCMVRWEDGPARLRDLKRRQATVTDSAPLVFATVDHGQVHLYAFDVMEAPRFFPAP
ncbi:uncharacterized protein Tsen54 [Dermacentor albipictus]|uniref:uncharacterized protein Tsen54 n=1 Tax=Dermacentor albipictus TaxID=60249 RepID=UPI0031FD715F